VLRDDFHADSDIDILVAFAPTADWGLLDRAQMQQDLEALLGRSVDLISKRAIARAFQLDSPSRNSLYSSNYR
jgi:hypothetical protein